jgi:UDP-2,3-diacylglucosamine hydrolase
LKQGKKIYFASDFHLGIPNADESLVREKKIVRWLSQIEHDAEEIFLVGDVFDFWFEYKTVVPKGYARLFGKIAQLTDQGISVHYFTGNHDMWTFGYLEKQLGVTLHRNPITRNFNQKVFFIGHGDGLGPGDYGYKFIKKVFNNPICKWLFARFHPNFGVGLANFWSKRSRLSNGAHDDVFHGEEKERLAVFCKEYIQKQPVHFFVFGHRHLPLQIKIAENTTYFNLGEWVNYSNYLVFDGETCQLMTFEN